MHGPGTCLETELVMSYSPSMMGPIHPIGSRSVFISQGVCSFHESLDDATKDRFPTVHRLKLISQES
jgi:hypothetical protein